MSRWSGALRALVPGSLAARGLVLVILVVIATLVPGFIGHRINSARLQGEQHQLTEALLAAALAAHIGSHDEAEDERGDWLSRVGEPARRVRWAGIFDSAGHGLEFRRQAAVTLSQIAAQIDRGARVPRSVPLRIDGQPSQRFVLVTIPRPRDGLILAMVYEAGLPAKPDAALAWPAVLALAGLALAWTWFELAIARPIRGLSGRLVKIQSGLTEAALDSVPLTELRGLASAVEQTHREMKRWQAEATHLRHTVDVRVDARTRGAAQAQRQAEHEAETDALTRLGNRRAIERDLPHLFSLHLRSGAELSLVMLDIDHFKRLNDTLGHPRGDEVLAFVGELLRAARCAGGERAFRYGGDEFALVLPGVTAAEAVEVARRLTLLFTQRARALPSVRPLPSLSAGVAALREHKTPTWESLLRLADEAMYLAKRCGCGVTTGADARAVAATGG